MTEACFISELSNDATWFIERVQLKKNHIGSNRFMVDISEYCHIKTEKKNTLSCSNEVFNQSRAPRVMVFLFFMPVPKSSFKTSIT